MRRATAVSALLGAALLAPAAARASDPGLMRRALGWDSDPLRDKYEELFDQKYPAHGYDPFNRLLPFEDVQAFDRAFDQRAAGVSRQVEQTDSQVVMTVTWPGSGARAIDVDVRRGVVRLAPSGAQEATGQYRFRAALQRELELEVPAGAVESSAKVAREGDRIRITFDRAHPSRTGRIWVSGTGSPEPEPRGGVGE